MKGNVGEYTYRTTGGIVQTIFDTKYGAGKSAEELGNVSRYSKNAQAAIKNTKTVKVVKVGGKIFLWIGVGLDAVKVIHAYSTNDPKAGEYARKAGLNTSVALGSATIPVVGWMFGAIYFIGMLRYRVDGGLQWMQRQKIRNRIEQ